jgi:ABC-2 type transport system permease protein
MNLHIVRQLVLREAALSTRNTMLLFALVLPIVLSLVLNLLFDSAVNDRPRLALTAQTAAVIPADHPALVGIAVTVVADAAALRNAVERGAADIGLQLDAGTAGGLSSGQPVELAALIRGESLQRDRVLISSALAAWARSEAGQPSLITLTTERLGTAQNWQERLMPLLLMVSLAFGAIIFPASSLVLEQSRRTLQALHVTPAGTGEILASKGLLGVIIAVLMSFVVLLLNNRLGSAGWPIGVAVLPAAVFAAQIGLLIGTLVHTIEALFAVFKSLALFLYAPAVLALFPQVPDWVARCFPTYYMIQPLLDLTVVGTTLSDTAPLLAVLCIEIILMIPLLAFSGRRMLERA